MVFSSKITVAAALLIGAIALTPALAQSPKRDLATEEANRKLVLEMYDRVFNKHQVEEGAKVIADNYIQHNPLVPDGKAPFVGFFSKLVKENPGMRTRVVRSAAEGDLVWVHSHSTRGEGDRGRAIVDIFRIKDGKIVEHWDVIQAVPEKANNNNTMF